MGDEEVNWGDEEVREKPMGDEEARRKECGRWRDERWDVRERESEKECRITWMSVGARIMMWRCLEEKKKILSASVFNLYYRL